MKNHFIASLLFTVYLFFPFVAHSQVYPVSTITQVTTPYPVSLDEFVNGTPSKVQVNININDATLDAYPVKLRMKLKSNSVTISTSASYVTDPLYLTAGENLVLDASDVSALFQVANLDFSGYSKGAYQQNGYLPEGVYQLSFEVLHYTRGYTISSSIPAYIYIYVNSPPILNLPANKLQMQVSGTQNILFSWAFQHSVYSYPGFAPEYLFELWEVYPVTLDADAVALSSEPIYTQTLQNTSLTYTDAEPLLVTGRKYAWRVRVIDPQETAVFKNNGYSEVHWFTYGVDCQPPVLSQTSAGASTLSIKWEPPQTMNSFYVQYVPAKDSSGDWYGVSTEYLDTKIQNLDASTKYYIEVKGKCGTQESDYSNRLTLNTAQDVDYQCGGTSSASTITNTTLITTLNRGDIIKAGDFNVEIYSATGSGTFSGKGYVLVPLLNFIRLIATLDNIQVNTDYRLISGKIITVYDLSNSLTVNLTDIINNLIGDTKTESNSFTDISTSTLAGDNISVSGNTVKVDNTSVTVDSAQSVVSVTSSTGKQFAVDVATSTVYQQSTTNSEAPRSSALSTSTPTSTDSTGNTTVYSVAFSKHGKQNGGFDAPGSKTPEGNYNSETANGSTTLAPWKSVLTGGMDRIMATITGTPNDSIFFSRESAQMVMTSAADKDNQRQLLVTGDGDQEDDQLYAWYRQITTTKKDTTTTSSTKYYKAGAIHLVSYEKIAIDLVLVSVNNSTAPNADYIKQVLDTIYNPAFVTWNINSLENGLTVELSDAAGTANSDNTWLDNTDADENMNFTYQEKLVRNAMKKLDSYDSDKYYLFFLNSGKDASMNGYMIFKNHFGFIFKNSQNPDVLARTIAHEIAHGAFRLRHTFSTGNKFVQTQGTTDNLMDYVSSGSALTARRLLKYQWDYVHNPETMWFTSTEDGSEGESVIINTYLSTDLANPDGTFTFITPGGNYINLPNKAYGIIFNHGILSWDKKNIVTGTLLGFSYNYIDYVFHYSGNDFDYYISNTNNLWLNASVSDPDGYIIGLPSIDSYNLYKIKGCTLNAHKPGIKETIKNERTFSLDLNGICQKSDNKIVKYSYKSNNELLANNQYQITDYETEMLKSHENGREQLAISKIAQIRSMYPSVFSNFCTFYDRWDTPAAIGTKEWDEKVFTNQNALKDLWTTDKKEFYLQMLESFINYCDQNNLAKNNILTNITESTDRSEVIKALESCSLDELIKMSVAQKLIIISKILEGTCLWNLGNGLDDNSEKLLNLIIQQTSDEKVDSLLTGLSNSSKFDSKESIISKIICRTNDSKILYGSDNYKELLKIFTVLCKKSILYTTQAITAKFDPDKKIDYTYSSFWLSQLDPIGTKSYNTTLNENGKIELTVKTITGHSTISAEHTYSTVALYDTEPTISLNPFEPIIFLNNCDLGMLSEFKDPEGFVAPAIFLKYVSDKASNVTSVDITMAVLDLSSITTGFGELSIGLTGWRKAWAMADMINGGINLTANVEGVANNETAREILQIYNTFTGVTALGRLSTSGVKGIYNVIQSTKSEAVILRAFDLNRLFVTINKAGLNLRAIPDNDLLNLEKYLQKILDDATARGLTNVTKEAEEALGNIKGAILARQLDFATLAKGLDSEGGHSYSDHGAQTTESQHLNRLKTGETPGGESRGIPESSSKFVSDEMHINAYKDALKKLETEKINTKGGLKKKVEIINQPLLGTGINFSLDASGNIVKTACNKYTAIFRLDQTTNKYKLVTLFPN